MTRAPLISVLAAFVVLSAVAVLIAYAVAWAIGENVTHVIALEALGLAILNRLEAKR